VVAIPEIARQAEKAAANQRRNRQAAAAQQTQKLIFAQGVVYLAQEGFLSGSILSRDWGRVRNGRAFWSKSQGCAFK
jgi:hypothetical protein